MVLLKGCRSSWIHFFHQYPFPEAKDLLSHPRAALTFYWVPLRRQVRIEGRWWRVAKQEADAYFATRTP